MTWTKFSERLPEESEEAVCVINSSGRLVLWTRSNTPNNSWKDYASEALKWHPVTYPAPPKEETQEEKDHAAWLGAQKDGDQNGWRGIWDAALRHERAEVAKLLNTGEGNPVMRSKIPSIDALNQLRRRCGLSA